LLAGKSKTSRTSVMLVVLYSDSALTPAASAMAAFSAAPSGSQPSYTRKHCEPAVKNCPTPAPPRSRE
jgi:hypothetical protein